MLLFDMENPLTLTDLKTLKARFSPKSPYDSYTSFECLCTGANIKSLDNSDNLKRAVVSNLKTLYFDLSSLPFSAAFTSAYFELISNIRPEDFRVRVLGGVVNDTLNFFNYQFVDIAADIKKIWGKLVKDWSLIESFNGLDADIKETVEAVKVMQRAEDYNAYQLLLAPEFSGFTAKCSQMLNVSYCDMQTDGTWLLRFSNSPQFKIGDYIITFTLKASTTGIHGAVPDLYLSVSVPTAKKLYQVCIS